MNMHPRFETARESTVRELTISKMLLILSYRLPGDRYHGRRRACTDFRPKLSGFHDITERAAR